MKKIIASLMLAAAMATASATPTYAEVESAMAHHDYKTARTMLTEVLRKRPEAVRAHAINVNLLIAEKASQKDIAAEQVVTRNLVADAVVSPTGTPIAETKSYWLRGILIVLLTVISGFAAFLLNEWRVARKRKKQATDETDSSNYTTHMSIHKL